MPQLTVPVSQRDHSKGPAGGGLTLVEYGDLECPHCALVHPIVAEIAHELRDSLVVVFRHFPLTRVHPRSQRAAEAAEAAGSQGKFWEMLDLMYQNPEDLSDDSFARLAKKLKLDCKRFARDMEGQVFRDRVRADFLSGIRSGVNGTPTFYINGERYGGAYDFDAIVAALLTASRAR